MTLFDGRGSGTMQRDEISSLTEPIRSYDDRAARVWLYSSLFWLIFITLIGLTMATELVTPNLFAGVPYLVFSRIRPIHVNGVIFAWLTMMYFGGAFYVLPRLLGLPSMWSERMAIVVGWLWNAMFAGGVVTLSMGYTQGREYTELIWPLDVALAGLLLINIFNILMTVLTRRVRPLYVTVWCCVYCHSGFTRPRCRFRLPPAPHSRNIMRSPSLDSV